MMNDLFSLFVYPHTIDKPAFSSSFLQSRLKDSDFSLLYADYNSLFAPNGLDTRQPFNTSLYPVPQKKQNCGFEATKERRKMFNLTMNQFRNRMAKLKNKNFQPKVFSN